MTAPSQRHGAIFGIAAAALFGLSTPLAKLLLVDAPPLMLAALLYIGAGAALTLLRALSRSSPKEVPLRRRDVGPLVGILVTGGVLGPVLMLMGLERLHGMTSALLLNLEAPLTIGVALLAFGEHLTKKAALGAGLIVAGAIVLTPSGGGGAADWLGALAIAAACLSWAVDNNLTQRLSLRDPLQLVQVKTLGAGLLTLLVALALGDKIPQASTVAASLLLGALSYGLSIVLDAHALRILGAAREAGYFATAPFIGAVLAVPLLGDVLSLPALLGGALMALGVAAMVREKHGHVHAHEILEHEHLHWHDEHHHHAHPEGNVGARCVVKLIA